MTEQEHAATTRPPGETNPDPNHGDDTSRPTVRPLGVTLRPEPSQTRRPRGDVTTVLPQGKAISTGTHSTDSFPHGKRLILTAGEVVLGRCLAQSGEAEVYEADLGGVRCAFKYFYSNVLPNEQIVKRWSGLRHPGILNLLDFGQIENRHYELTEFAEGSTLIREMPIRDTVRLRNILEQVIEGLDFCHRNGIIHRDIKPDNLFFRDLKREKVAISDFGISSVVQGDGRSQPTTLKRTNVYAAPELFMDVNRRAQIGPEVDFYALGITLLTLWRGKHPFEGLNEFKMMSLKLHESVPIPQNLPPDWTHLVASLTAAGPRDRPSADQIRAWLAGKPLPPLRVSPEPGFKPYPFRSDQGVPFIARSPQELADLFEENPNQGKRHLYKHAVISWVRESNPGLYVSLLAIVEDEYPKNMDAGLIRAIYVLDRNRPFRGLTDRRIQSDVELAAELEQNSDIYISELQRPDARFYIYLKSTGRDEEAQRYWGLFKDGPPRQALNLIILLLEGAAGFRHEAMEIEDPDQVLKISPTQQAFLAGELADCESKFSIWMDFHAEFVNTVGKWRNLARRDPVSLRYALGLGPKIDVGEFRVPEDVIALLRRHPKELLSSLDELNYWLGHYHETSVYQLAHQVLLESDPNTQDLPVLLDLALWGEVYRGNCPFQVIAEAIPGLQAMPLNEDGRVIQAAIAVEGALSVWLGRAGPGQPAFVDRLLVFSNVAKTNQSHWPMFWKELARRMDSRIPAGVRGDLEGRLEDLPYLERILDARDEAVAQLQEICPELKSAQSISDQKKRLADDAEHLRKLVKESKAEAEREVEAKEAEYLVNARGKIHKEFRGPLKRRGVRILVAGIVLIVSVYVTDWAGAVTPEQFGSHWLPLTLVLMGALIGSAVGIPNGSVGAAGIGCFVGFFLAMAVVVYGFAFLHAGFLTIIAVLWLQYETLRVLLTTAWYGVKMSRARISEADHDEIERRYRRLALQYEKAEPMSILRRRAELAIDAAVD